MTYREYFANKTTKELKKEGRELERSIFDIDCFSVSDLKMLTMIDMELERRENDE